MTLLHDLEASYTEHRCCGDIRCGVEGRDGGEVVWFECECSARITRPLQSGSDRNDVER